MEVPAAPQLILPEPHELACTTLLSDHANRERRVSRPGCELEIAEPDLPVIVEALTGSIVLASLPESLDNRMVQARNPPLLERNLEDFLELQTRPFWLIQNVFASQTRYVPKAMSAAIRSQEELALLAASIAVSFQMLLLPSGAGSLIGQRKSRPCLVSDVMRRRRETVGSVMRAEWSEGAMR